MNWQLTKEINRIKHDVIDIKDPVSVYKYEEIKRDFDFAIVTDNNDPDNLGRVKVQFPHWGENITSTWAIRTSPYAGNEEGWWSMPEIGEQVLCGFLNNDPAFPIILGSMFTPRAIPPIEAKEENSLKYFTTRSGARLIIDDTDGEEKIIIHNGDASMRLVVDSNSGLNIVNENGDINIKCKKLTINSSDAAAFTINGETKITAKEVTLDSGSSDMAIKSEADVVLSGDPIDLKGSLGVTAEMKQIAKENDQVIGIDFHQIEVPSVSGLQPVPMIPHPYLGKLVDNLSEDVKVCDAAAAFKGSKSKFDTPGHIAMPPGVKFTTNPNNEGEVSNMTVPSVLINGNEAATLGSMVKTCSDPQPMETCTIIAVGAPVCLPIMLPGMDPEEFERAGGTVINTQEPVKEDKSNQEETEERKITSVSWPSAGKVNEEITLTANLNNQKEGANVYFKIFKKGDDPKTDPPIKKVTGKNSGGTAEAKWFYPFNPKKPLAEKPKFFFEANSFLCGKEKSEEIEIGADIEIKLLTPLGEGLKDQDYKLYLPDGSEIKGKTDGNGLISEEDLIPGHYELILLNGDTNE